MAKKKGVQRARTDKPLSAIEEQVRAGNLENEQLKRMMAERKKILNETEAVKAQERTLLGRTEEEFDEAEEGLGRGPAIPMQNRHRFMSPRAVERESEESLAKQEQFERTLADFQETQGMVDVYRLRDGTYAKMASIDAKDWGDGLEGVAKRFGGGTFKVRLRAPDGTFAGETIVRYDEEAYPRPSEKSMQQQAPAVDQVGMLRTINEMNERSNERMMMMFKGMMDNMVAMNTNKSSMLNNMNDLMAFKDMLAEKKNPATELNTLVGVLQKGMELGANTAAPEEGLVGSILGRLLTGDNISKLAQAFTLPVPAPAEALQPAPPAQRPAPKQIAQQPAPKLQKEKGMSLMVSMYKPIILGYAKKKENPHKIAEMIVSRIAGINDGGYLLIVDDFLKLPDTKEAIVYAQAPELKPHDKWVSAVMVEMSNIIFQLISGVKAKRAKKSEAKAPPVPAEAGAAEQASTVKPAEEEIPAP